MPNPITGTGIDISKGLRKYSWAMWMAAVGSAAVIPTQKLVGAEPAAPWVRQGRIKGDEFAWNMPEPTFLEGRAGFIGILKYRVVKQAELPVATVPLDETDADILNRLRGNAAGSQTSLSSGIYTGNAFNYVPGKFFGARVLFVGTGVNGAFERQIAGLNSFVTFKFVSNPDSEGVEVTCTFAADSNNIAFQMQEWE